MRRDMMLAAGVAAAWGFNFLVIGWGMHGIPPLLFVAIRFAVVAAFIVVVPRPARRRGARSSAWGSS